MNEKLTDSKKQVLLMTDAANPQALKAVTGIDKNGNPSTVNPDKANIADFLVIDKNGNALENFFKKFLEQTKNPAHTGFFPAPLTVLVFGLAFGQGTVAGRYGKVPALLH